MKQRDELLKPYRDAFREERIKALEEM